MSADRRVVLVKPGDVLILGNLSRSMTDPTSLARAASLLREQAGIRAILMCADDVSISTRHESEAMIP